MEYTDKSNETAMDPDLLAALKGCYVTFCEQLSQVNQEHSKPIER